MALATLSIDLVARLAQFERDMGGAARATEQMASRVSKSIGVAKSAVGTLIGGFTLTAIASLVRAQVTAVDAFNDLKDASGASIENISALDDLARRTGTTFDVVGSSLIKFNAALTAAKPGSDQARVFEAIGLDVKKLRDLDPAEAMRQTAVALSKFADDGNKARAVQELFGKSLREAAPFLKDLAENGPLLAKVTTEQAEAAERFNKQLFEMETNSNALKRELVMGLIPAMSQLLANYKAIKELGSLDLVLKDAARGLLPGFTPKLEGDPGQNINTQLAERAKLERDLASAQKEGRLPHVKALQEEIATVNRYLAVLRAKQQTEVLSGFSADVSDAQSRRLASAAGGTRSLKIPGAPGTPSAAIAIQQKIAERLTAAYDEARDPLHKLTEDEKFAIKVVTDLADAKNKLTDVEKRRIASQLETLLLTSQQNEASKREAETVAASAKIIGDAYEEEAKGIEAWRKKMANRPAELDAALYGFSGEGEAARKRLLTARLEERLNAGEVVDPATLDRMVRGIGGVNEELTKTTDLAGDFASVFESGFEKAILSGEKLSDVLKALGLDILQIALRTGVTQPLGKWAGGALAGMFSSFLPSFDIGTDFVPTDMVAKIHKGERIIPAAQNRPGALGGATIIINNTIGSVASKSDVVAGMQQVRSQIFGQLARSRGYGGITA